MVITVSLNPAQDKAIAVDGLTVDGVNRVVSTRVDAGGKGINVAKILKVLGDDPLAMGIVGGSSGEFIRQQLTDMQIRHDFVIGDKPTRTNLKITDRIRRTTTELNDPGEPVSDELLHKVWEKIDAAAKPGDIVVISGKNPPEMKDGILSDWIEKLQKKGVRTALDTVDEAMRLAIKAKPAIIKPNQAELADILGEELHYVRDIIAAARKIAQQGVELVIVSMGGDGAFFVTSEHVLRGYGLKVELSSTVGSGDAMLAATIYYSQKGCTLEETARWSIATSAANAMCEGSATPSMDMIRELEKNVVVERLM